MTNPTTPDDFATVLATAKAAIQAARTRAVLAVSLWDICPGAKLAENELLEVVDHALDTSIADRPPIGPRRL